MWRRAGLALVFIWFVIGGIGHFVATDAFASVVPAYVPFPREVVLATGLCEIAGALTLLWPRTRRLAGWALIAFAICVTPVHIDMLLRADHYTSFGTPMLWLRLLFQPVFIWIIWAVTKPERAR